MPLLQYTARLWEDSYRAFARQASGNFRKKIKTTEYPWANTITLIEGDQQEDAAQLTIPVADVLNCAVEQKHSLQAVLGAESTKDKELVILRVGSGTAAVAAASSSLPPMANRQPPTINHLPFRVVVPGCCTEPAQPTSQQPHVRHVQGPGRRGAGAGADSGVCGADPAVGPPSLAAAPGACRESPGHR